MGHPLADTKLADLTFVAFDTETTGLSPIASRLVELSGVKFLSGGQLLSSFSSLINPEQPIPPESTAIHGITDEMVRDKPSCASVIPDFLDWAAGENLVLAAHNAQFDAGFLEVALARLRIPPPACPILDTLALGRLLVPAAPNHQLRTLTEYLQLESGSYHRALADSHHVRDLLTLLLKMVPEVKNWHALSELCGVLYLSDLYEDGLDRIDSLPDGFESIRDVISSGQTIRMVYSNGVAASRVVTPQSVHLWRGNLYLSGFCHLAGSERTFRLDKIVSFQVVSD